MSAVRISNVNGRGGFVTNPVPAPGVWPLATGSGLSGMDIAGEGLTIRLEGDWRAKVEESWQGGRRRAMVPNVLVASRLLNAGESTVVAFDAPAEPGEYPFVCSFPGHWATMRGVLRIE